jgi:hypothetical protein
MHGGRSSVAALHRAPRLVVRCGGGTVRERALRAERRRQHALRSVQPARSEQPLRTTLVSMSRIKTAGQEVGVSGGEQRTRVGAESGREDAASCMSAAGGFSVAGLRTPVRTTSRAFRPRACAHQSPSPPRHQGQHTALGAALWLGGEGAAGGLAASSRVRERSPTIVRAIQLVSMCWMCWHGQRGGVRAGERVRWCGVARTTASILRSVAAALARVVVRCVWSSAARLSRADAMRSSTFVRFRTCTNQPQSRVFANQAPLSQIESCAHPQLPQPPGSVLDACIPRSGPNPARSRSRNPKQLTQESATADAAQGNSPQQQHL